VLLQILDDGRLTDSQGRTVDFKNTTIILTSNVGSQYISELDPTQDEEMRRRVNEAVRESFRPEFLNRIDEIVIFKQLSRAQIREIVELQLGRVRKRLEGRHIALDISPSAMDFLGNEGFDPVYGARPLKRVIQRRLLDHLAVKLMDGSVRDGDVVVVDVKDGKLDIQAQRSEAVTV
ncbi:MAG: AAA family ATPase, partial [Chloroflexia bacterium]